MNKLLGMLTPKSSRMFGKAGISLGLGLVCGAKFLLGGGYVYVWSHSSITQFCHSLAQLNSQIITRLQQDPVLLNIGTENR